MISDPNILETGEQAARSLHSISGDECCFHVCSEDTREGICVNCEEPWKHGDLDDRGTAPQCDSPPQSGSTGRRGKNTPRKIRTIKTIVGIMRKILHI